MLPELTTNGFHIFQPFSWVLAEGEDAHEFLQSQFSNDLSNLETGDSCYGLWLDQKGKVHGDSQVIRAGEERFYLFSYFSKAEGLVGKLEKFIVADDVELADLGSEMAGVSLLGSAVNGFAELESGELERLGLHTIPGRRSSAPSLDIILPKEHLQQLLEWIKQLGALSELDASDLEAERILSRIPRIPEDIGPNELPQEGRLENDGVSFTKGCYLGQEVMSRLHSMGQVRRSLQLIRSASEIPLGATLLLEGKKVGVAKTSFGYAGQYFGVALISNTVPEQSTLQLGDSSSEPEVVLISSSDG